VVLLARGTKVVLAGGGRVDGISIVPFLHGQQLLSLAPQFSLHCRLQWNLWNLLLHVCGVVGDGNNDCRNE
jgi:hypothetical protein